jgi:hypothetical protein
METVVPDAWAEPIQHMEIFSLSKTVVAFEKQYIVGVLVCERMTIHDSDSWNQQFTTNQAKPCPV